MTGRPGKGNNAKVCQLHLAKSVHELNELIGVIPRKSAKLLVNTAQKLVKEAQQLDKRRDEEKAYLLYMRYFQVVETIQKDKNYHSNKKYYDGLLDPKTTVTVIERAEELQKSLERRYDFAKGAAKAEKQEEERRGHERKKKNNNEDEEKSSSQGKKDEKLDDDDDVKLALERWEREREAKKTASRSTPSPLPPLSNGIDSSDGPGCLTCQNLYSLYKERCSTYLVLDARPRHDFLDSHMKLPNLISVPEEILKPGLTAGKITTALDECGQTLWIMQRHNVEHLVLVDWCTEDLPLPTPLQVLSDAMLKWDPGKKYRGLPKVLAGGYELWCLMYPMLTTNPRPAQHTSTAAAAASTSRDGRESSSSLSLLNFEYPDLNEAFVLTPSPPTTPHSLPSTPHTHPTTTTQQHHHPTPTLTHTHPQINRTLKPKLLDKEIMDSRNNNTIANNIISSEESTPRPSLGSNVNTWESRERAWEGTKESNIILEQQRSKQGSRTMPEKVDNVLPFVPSRSLKPKDLLESLAANKKELEEEQKLLQESLQIEEDTIKKMEEMEATSSQRETASDDQSRARLQATEDRLREEIRRLEGRSLEMEESYKRMEKQNEELWKMVNQALANQLGGITLASGSPATPPDLEPEQRRQEEEQEKLRQQQQQKKAMQEQVERMRRERKEKEQRLKEQAERERKQKEQKAREAEAERLKQEERRSRIDADARPHKNKGSNSSGSDTYTTKLRGSPRSSPVRGSNLRRSHSAFNLSQQDEETNMAAFPGGVAMPDFDRALKPRVTPQRRNINAARQRNFEPKYGSVPPAKTGLKNLGNTCYMNSMVQCLNNTKPLVKYFLNGTYSNDINPGSKSEGDVAEEVGAVVRALWSGQYRSIAMWDLKNIVGRYHKPFCGYDQHDSHEFLLKLMDWLHDDLNKVTVKRLPMKEQNHENVPDYVAADKIMEELRQRDDSILSALFHGLHRSTIECGTCGHVSLTFEPFSVISLSFPNNRKCSLRDLLHHYYKETNLEYKCCKCKKKRNCIRKADIWKLPPVLVLHLNRFEHDVLMKKQQNFVDFPVENLDLSKYICFQNRYTKYDLYAVCNHYGTMDGGHYTAFCRSPTNNRTWYRFDDHEVYELSNIKTSAAYVLFYEATNTNISIV